MSRRTRWASEGDGGAQVDLAPLIDIVFILLIFFMVTTSFVRESGLEISRPESAFAQPETEAFLSVGIDAEGTVSVGGQRTTADNVRAVREALATAGIERVLVVADEATPTGLLLEVLDTCKRAGGSPVDVAATRASP